MNEHAEVDIDLLADYIGGALDGPDEAAVARLIAEDPRWRETYELLAPGMAGVGAELQALGARPEPMPADVAARLEAALASPIAEPSVIDPSLTTPAEPHLAPVRDGRRHLHAVPGAGAGTTTTARRRRLRWAAPIAAAAGVLAFAAVGLDHLTRPSEDVSSAAGSAEEAAPMMDSGALASGPAGDRITASGTEYTRATLGAQMTGAMNLPDTSTRSSGKASQSAVPAGPEGRIDALYRLRGADGLAACLEAIAEQRGGIPIIVESVDYARYDGSPAVVVRFVADGVTWAVAAGPECGAPGRGANSLGTARVG